MKKKIIASLTAVGTTLIPFMALAQIAYIPVQSSDPNPRTLADVVGVVVFYLNVALEVLMAASVVVFVYFIIKYFMIAGANRAEAGTYVMWSVLGFFIILSIWGIVGILTGTFGLSNQNHQFNSWQNFTSLFPHN
ncbi:MAG: hypothetical protein KGI49_01000 [Patescibacteria group bacterium]|nr:hypothetical protein [Patescibacteria group bacterium]